MTTIVAASSRHACRQGRAILLCRRLLSSSAAAATDGEEEEQARGDGRSRLNALRERLRDEEGSAAAAKLQDFAFSGDVSYGTAVPRRTRDKTTGRV